MNRLRVSFTLLITMVLIGCAGMDNVRDGYMNLRTKFANGFQDISVEVSPAVQKIAKIEDLKIEANAYMSEMFEVIGNVTYPKNCKFLALDVKFLAKNGTNLGAAKGIVQNYTANEKSRFKAPLMNMPTSSRELLNKARVDSLTCQ